MKSILHLAPLLGLAVNAFPSFEHMDRLQSRETRSSSAPLPVEIREQLAMTKRQLGEEVSKSQTNCGPRACTIFNAEEQFVSTTGNYAYASPLPSEIRGPCPGLNAAANHGYLPRSGYATILETIDGMAKAYAMSAEVAAALAAYAVVMDGNVLGGTWSIGGPQPAPTLGGLLGKPQGISYSHNKYEGDTSIGRNDAYLNNGDAHSLNVTRFAKAYALGMDDDRYTLDKFRRASGSNQEESVANNPYYFAPLFSTTIVTPAAYNFVINFMSNHSAEEPSGYLNGDMFKTFFAVEGDYPNFTWLPGQERIPENWYRRPTVNAYNVLDVFLDLIAGWVAYPETFRLGGNIAGVNSYVGVDLSLMTGGTYTLENIFEGNNFACFVFQVQQQAVPDILKGLVSDVGGALDLLNQYTGNLLDGLTCPQLAKYNSSVFNSYPGRNYSPTGPATNY